MAKSTAGYASKPFGPGADRFMLQPYGRYTNASRFAGEVDGLEAIESVARAYPIDRDRMVMAGFSMGGASAWSYTVHYADRWVAAAPGAGFAETRVFLRGDLARQPQNAVQQTLWHLYDATDYAAEYVQRAGRRLLRRQRWPEAGGRRDGRGDARRGAEARARHRSEHGTLIRTRGATAGSGSAGSTGRHRTQPGAQGGALHHLDAQVQQDVLGHGRGHDRALGASESQRVHRRRRDSRDDQRRVGAPRRIRSGAVAVRRRGQADADRRWHRRDTARRRARQVASRQPRPHRRRLENRRTVRRRPPESPRAAGADRRCIHGVVRLRAADWQAFVRVARRRGRASRPTMPSASGFISFAANHG